MLDQGNFLRFLAASPLAAYASAGRLWAEESLDLIQLPEHLIKSPAEALDVFEKILTTGAEYLEEHGAQKWLSDDRNSVVIAEEDVHWGETVWAPRVIEAGFRYWAVVTPATAVAAEQMERA